MKRFIALVVALIGAELFYFVVTLMCRIVWFGVEAFAELGTGALIAVILVAGSTVLGIFGFAVFLASLGIVELCQRIEKSKNGGRYIFTAVIFGLFYAATAAGSIFGFVRFGNPFIGYAECVCMIIFVIALAAFGKNKAIEDGPPPTKIEKLEAKLAKEKEKEDFKELMDYFESLKTHQGK